MIHRCQRMGAVVLGTLVLSVNVLGQSASDKERQSLLDEALKARDADDHARALSLAARAAQIRMTTSLREFIAEEQKAVGRLADSMNNAEICVREATENKALREREKILSLCKGLIAELQKSSARIIISMFNRAPPQTQVIVSGNVVPESLYGLPYYTSPGNIRVEASAPGHLSFHRELIVGRGEEATVTVDLPPETGAVPVSQAPQPQPAAVVSARPEGPSLREVGPYIVMGAGVVSLGASAIFLIARNNAIHDLEAQCVGPNHTSCPDTAKVGSLQNQASSNNLAANITMIVGGAALVGGGVWWFLDRNRSPAGSRASLQIIPTQGGAVVTVAGAL